MLLKIFRTKERKFAKERRKFDLIIFDDIYPHPASGFRMEEFSRLLERFDNSKVILSGTAYRLFQLPAEQHQQHITDLRKSNRKLQGKLEQPDGITNINCKLFYCIFLHNMHTNLSWINKYHIPFVFTLYPGGGFKIGIEECDRLLLEIFSSSFFRKVIVTQKKTYNYLIEKGLCVAEKIVFIFGVVMPQESMLLGTKQKKRFGIDKAKFDICFCATKYTPFGEDKGYPLFISFAKIIAQRYPFTYFHVIGGFDRELIDVEELGNRISFYGYQEFDGLRSLFGGYDLIISPNQPDKLAKGAFDGFPLGTVIEAAFNMVGVMLTDCNKENLYFEDGKDLIIIEPVLEDMLEKFDELVLDIDGFYAMAEKGRDKFRQIYSNDYQMQPRIKLLTSLVDSAIQ